MTSQVAITNHAGIALASDTVVTQFVSGGTKTIGNTPKIIELGLPHKVAVMLSGAVSTNGIMYRLLVNEWASSLDSPLATVRDYAISFTNWINTSKDIYDDNLECGRANELLNDHYYYLARRVDNIIQNARSNNEECDESEILMSVAREGREYLDELDFWDDLKSADSYLSLFDSTRERFINLDEKIEYIFDEFGLSDALWVELKTVAPLILAKSQYFKGNATIAFVGFGATELFGRNIRVYGCGMFGGRFNHSLGPEYGVSLESTSSITAFAQDEAIFGFLRGFRWSFMEHVYEVIESKINEIVDNEEGADLGAEIVEYLREDVGNYYRSQFVDPLLNSIEGLDLSHLANLAESLVGMEATSAFGGDEPATVGGLVEVATIDRRNGLVWVTSLAK
jgi:hypothetical protein